jgi:hypothetical protein
LNQNKPELNRIPIKSITQELQLCSKDKFDQNRPIARDEIKTALKKIYSNEAKPVNVRSIRNRTGIALLFLVLGSIIVAGMLGIKYLEFEQNLLMFGILLILIAFPAGFLLSTKYMRKIYSSMSRFKDREIPSYRTVPPKSTFQTTGVVVAALLCLILVGAQSLNLFVVNNDFTNIDDIEPLERTFKFESKYFSFDEVIIGKPEQDLSGQYYRTIGVDINNTQKYYSKDLIFEVESRFAGAELDYQNETLDDPEAKDRDHPSIKIKINEPEDTIIITRLLYDGPYGKVELAEHFEKADADIYIKSIKGTVEKITPSTKIMNVDVVVYNDGHTRVENSVSIIVSKYTFKGWDIRGYEENNQTIKRGETWEISIEIDIYLNEDSVFDVELKYDDETKDKTVVKSE